MNRTPPILEYLRFLLNFISSLANKIGRGAPEVPMRTRDSLSHDQPDRSLPGARAGRAFEAAAGWRDCTSGKWTVLSAFVSHSIS